MLEVGNGLCMLGLGVNICMQLVCKQNKKKRTISDACGQLLYEMEVCEVKSLVVRHLAISNNSRTSFSDSPRYLEDRLDDAILKNAVPHSVATALASNVLPVPGGPIIATPCKASE